MGVVGHFNKKVLLPLHFLKVYFILILLTTSPVVGVFYLISFKSPNFFYYGHLLSLETLTYFNIYIVFLFCYKNN